MIITDFNEMGIDVLMTLNEGINMEFEINDGKITGTQQNIEKDK